MPKPTNPTSVVSLKKLANVLRNAEPEGFDRFLKELAAYTDEVTVAVTEAPPEEILCMQGRAQQARAILRVFAECHITAAQPFNPTPTA